MSKGNTVKLHRVFKAPADVVYKAFLDPQALLKWNPPDGFTAEVHEMNATVGGTYRMSFTNFRTGTKHTFGGTYLELKPGELIKYNDQFEDPSLPGTIIATIELKPVMCGTEVMITQEGLPEQIPVEMCYLGWQESLTLLARLVDPEIPDQV